MTDFTDSHLFDNTPVPFHFYAAEGARNALQSVSQVFAVLLFVIFVFSLAGGNGPGEGFVPFDFAGASINGVSYD